MSRSSIESYSMPSRQNLPRGLFKLTRCRSPSILAGLIFDDRGNAMSPSHTNKKGARYRYYVSQALLQNRKTEAGSIARVSAPDVEALVCKAVKEAGRTDPETDQTAALTR
jgi:hypothetical protein